MSDIGMIVFFFQYLTNRFNVLIQIVTRLTRQRLGQSRLRASCNFDFFLVFDQNHILKQNKLQQYDSHQKRKQYSLFEIWLQKSDSVININMDITNTQQYTRSQQILRAQGISINSFYQQTPSNLFQEATSYPDFFKENLVSDQRVLKRFADTHSNIRIFYYQLLRVSYQTAVAENRRFINNLILIVFHDQFQILFSQDTDQQRDIFNDFQFKKLFAEFISIIENQQKPIIQQIIDYFPFIDIVFTHIIRSILATQGINVAFNTKIPTQNLFIVMGGLLGLKITSYGNCWKFEDSDMFCYEQSQDELYLAYIFQAPIIGDEKIPKFEPPNNEPREQRYMTKSMNEYKIVIVPSSIHHKRPLQQLQEIARESMNSDTYEHDIAIVQDIKNQQLKRKAESTLIQQVLQQKHIIHSQPTGRKQQLGDYYQDFTNSLILEKISEPQRSNIRRIKERVKSLRRPSVASLNTSIEYSTGNKTNNISNYSIGRHQQRYF